MYWDPEWVELAKAMGEMPPLPEEIDITKQQAVNGVLGLAASRLPPPPDDVSAYDDRVPGGPKVRVYKPTSSSADAENLPLILFIHGGGWFAGTLDTEDRTCRMLCSLAKAVVVSVDYVCGPNVALEREVEDCAGALHWSCDSATTLGADPKKMVVIGGSAGGALAVATVYAAVQAEQGDRVTGLVTLNGLALLPNSTPPAYAHLMKSYEENAGPLPFVSGDDTMALYKHWNITPQNINPTVFPAAGGPENLKGFPPTMVITSNNDASRDDGTVLEARLRDAGVKTKLVNHIGFAHYFWTFPLPNANERFWKGLVDGVEWTLSVAREGT